MIIPYTGRIFPEEAQIMLISFVRTVIMYIVVIIAMRALGKRQVGELETSELVITILISELAAIPMQNAEQPLISGIVPIAVLVFLGALSSLIALKSKKFRHVVYGKPSVVIENGKTVAAELKKLCMSDEELAEELRLQGVTELSDVKYGIVETSGSLASF
jgi:uncharacterized membrane protein YcaP (DUF421 family)